MNLETIFQGEPTPHKWRMLGDYLRGQKIQPGNGLLMEQSSSSGISFATKQARNYRQTQAPPFSVLSLKIVQESDPVQYKVTLQEGWVIERHTIPTQDGVQYHEVKIGADFMSARPYPELTIEDGDFIQVYFATDEEGYVDSVPVIQAGPRTDSVHHQPPSGEGIGANGYYYVDLFEFTIDNGKPVIVYKQQSDIEHYRRWSGQNIGGARYIHKEWSGADDRYDFRTLKQFEPVGRTYGKVIVDPVGNEFDDVNDDIKFSAIAERASDPQVNVNDDGAGTITVEGNNKDGYILWIDCNGDDTTLVSWEDGLVQESGEQVITAGCIPSGAYGDMLYHNGTQWVVLTNPGVPSLEYFVLTHNGTAPSWVDVDAL